MKFRYLIAVLLFIFSFPMSKGECKKHKITKQEKIANAKISASQRAAQRLLSHRKRTDLINYLITRNGYKSYLEIGVADGENYNFISVPYKIGVDPDPSSPCQYHMTSDEFFESNEQTFDIVFIDGLHLHEQVLRDVDHSLKCLNAGGIIVIDDCLPIYPEQQIRFNKGGSWNGDVWKAGAYIRMNYENVHFSVVNVDSGCGLVVPNTKQELFSPNLTIDELNWEFYNSNRDALLNVVSLENWLFSQ